MKKQLRGIAYVLTAAIMLPLLGGAATGAAAKPKISKSKLTMEQGQTKKLSVKNLKKSQKKKVKWSSSKKKVASVSKKGKVTAKKQGKATITARVGKKKYTCKVTVTAKGTKGDTKATATATPNAQATQSPTPKSKEQLAAEDRENLKALIAKQRAGGSSIPEIDALGSGYFYGWNADGRLTRLNITEDEGSNMGVSGDLDLTPFTALEEFDVCYNSKVTGINVKGLTALKELQCDETAVSALDISTNTALEKVSFEKTPVASIDLSNNPNLKVINARGSKLTALDVSKNPLLERLFCNKSVNVTGLSSKTTVQLSDQ